MRKKIFISLSLFFNLLLASTLLMTSYIYKFNLLGNLAGFISIIVFFMIAILLISNELSYYWSDKVYKSVNSYDSLMKEAMGNQLYLKELRPEIIENIKYIGLNPDETINKIKENQNTETMRKQFTSSITHELKSPLTSINGYAEIISHGMTKVEDNIRFASIILDEGNKLLKMIDEIIKVSEFDNKTINYHENEIFDLGDLIVDVVEDYRAIAEEKLFTINYLYREHLFYGNKKLLKDLIKNMVSNAIKYRREVDGYLNINLKEDDSGFTLIFEDNGIGISDEAQRHIFERFYVEDKSRKRKDSTGLGLSLVKHIVKVHRGSIELESQKNYGSIFTFRFPRLSKYDYKEKAF